MGKILLFVFSLIISNALFALTSGQITRVNANAPFFILDSNSPCTQGPSCGYVGVTITNVSGSTLTQVRVDFVSSSNANFFLTGNQPSQVKLYTLAPGQSATAFFYMKYSCTVNDTTTLTYSISDANSGTVSAVLPLVIGVNRLNLIARNAGGTQSSTAEVTVERNSTPSNFGKAPTIDLMRPTSRNFFSTTQEKVLFEAVVKQVADPSQITLTFDQQKVTNFSFNSIKRR